MLLALLTVMGYTTTHIFFLSIGMQIVTPEVVPVKLESAQRKVTLQWLYKANQNSMKNDSGHLKVVHLWDFLTCALSHSIAYVPF